MGPLGTAVAVVMFSSGFEVGVKIMRRKSVGEYSPYPYFVQSLQCCMWIIYAAAYYHTGHMLWPVVSNSYGAVCSSIVFGIYLRYCSPELRRRWLPCLLLFLPVALAGIVIFTLEYPLVLEAYSLFLLAVNLVMYSGPLAGIKRALEAKSVEFLPLSLGLSKSRFMFLNTDHRIWFV